jgi:hypothetical protein
MTSRNTDPTGGQDYTPESQQRYLTLAQSND